MTALEVYRDDGPLAELLGRRLGRALPAAPVALTIVGALPLAALLAVPYSPGVGAALALAVRLVGMLGELVAAGVAEVAAASAVLRRRARRWEACHPL